MAPNITDCKFAKVVFTPPQRPASTPWNACSPTLVGSRVFFTSDVDLSPSSVQEDSVGRGTVNIFSFDLAEHYKPFGRLKRRNGVLTLEIPSASVVQHTFSRDFPCRNLTATAVASESLESSDDECDDDGDGDDTVTASPTTGRDADSSLPTSPVVDIMAGAALPTARYADTHDATFFVFYQLAGNLHCFSCEQTGRSMRSVPLRDIVHASTAQAAETSVVVPGDSITTWIEQFEVHPAGHSMLTVCRGQVLELGLFAGPCYKVPCDLPAGVSPLHDKAASNTTSLRTIGGAKDSVPLPEGCVIDCAWYLADGRIMAQLSPDGSSHSEWSSFFSQASPETSLSNQVVVVIDRPPNRTCMTLLHVHVLARRCLQPGSSPQRGGTGEIIGKIQAATSCPGDSGVVLLRDDRMQLLLLYIPPPHRESATNAGVEEHSQTIRHPQHRHRLKLMPKGRFVCDICHRRANGARQPRHHCAKGCDWDACESCVQKVAPVANTNRQGTEANSGRNPPDTRSRRSSVVHRKQQLLDQLSGSPFVPPSPKQHFRIAEAYCTILDRGAACDGIGDICFGPAGLVKRPDSSTEDVSAQQWNWDSWSSLTRTTRKGHGAPSQESETVEESEVGHDADGTGTDERRNISLTYWCAYVKYFSSRTSSVLLCNLAPLVGMLRYVSVFGLEPSTNEADLQLLPDHDAGDYEICVDGQWFNDGVSRPTNVSGAEFLNSCPSFDPDGNFLYFLSARYFCPKSDFFGESMTFHEMQRPFVVRLCRTIPNPFLRNPWTPGNQEGSDRESSASETEEESESEGESERESEEGESGESESGSEDGSEYEDGDESESDDESKSGSDRDSESEDESESDHESKQTQRHERHQNSKSKHRRRGRTNAQSQQRNKSGARNLSGVQGASRRRALPQSNVRAKSSKSRARRRSRRVQGKTPTKNRMIRADNKSTSRRTQRSQHGTQKGGSRTSAEVSNAAPHEHCQPTDLSAQWQLVQENKCGVDLDGIQARTHVLPGTKVRRYSSLHALAGGRVLFSRSHLTHANPVRGHAQSLCKRHRIVEFT